MEALSSKRMTFDGVEYIVAIESDEFGGAPWDNEDGHGKVSDWVKRPKLPGELVVNKDGNYARYYDYAGAMATAKKENWGDGPDVSGETAAQKAHRAVMADYRRMKDFCRGEWSYVAVVVYPINEDDEPRRKWCKSVGGIESDYVEEYINEVARDLAGEVAASLAAKA